MTKATVIAFTAAIWTAGFAAVGALSYTIGKPLPPAPMVASIAHAKPTQAVKAARIDEGQVIVLPTIEFITSKARPVVKPTVDPPRDIAQMHCHEWRPLEQGSSSVQVCD